MDDKGKVLIALDLMHFADHEAEFCRSLDGWSQLEEIQCRSTFVRSFLDAVLACASVGLETVLNEDERALFLQHLSDVAASTWRCCTDSMNESTSDVELRHLLLWSRLLAFVSFVCRSVNRTEARLFLNALTLLPFRREGSFDEANSAGLSTQRDDEWVSWTLEIAPWNLPRCELESRSRGTWRRLQDYISRQFPDTNLKSFAEQATDRYVPPEILGVIEEFVSCPARRDSDEIAFNILLSRYASAAIDGLSFTRSRIESLYQPQSSSSSTRSPVQKEASRCYVM
ncbi:MAG: hypothetical protein MHM6MM_001631 [Cercozoa sp. M6MM]